MPRLRSSGEMREHDARKPFRTPVDEALRERLLQLVRIHELMFKRLVFEQSEFGRDVAAELLRDVGKTYLEFSTAFDADDDGVSSSLDPDHS